MTEDLQLATVKRLLPNIDTLPDDDALADAVMGVTEVYEDTVYALAHDVIAILRAYANVDKATSGKADLPMLSVAGLGIAFHAKPKVAANARQSINTIGLDGVLYFLGFKDSYLEERGKL